MKILVVCPHFTPDVAPTGTVMAHLVTPWVQRGHEVQIVTSLPWYEHHRIEPGWSHRLVQHEKTPWGWITRLHPFPTDKTNIAARAVAFGGFSVMAGLVASAAKFRPDVVFAMSPPISLGFSGWLAARRWRVPFVFNIQDVFPDVAIEVGALTNPRVIRAARAVERWLYRRSDAVTVLSQELQQNVESKLGRATSTRVRELPNFVDTTAIQPADRMTGYRSEFGLFDRTVVMYAGNLGYSQSVEVLIEAARRCADRDDVVFVVNGAGSSRARLQELASGLDNVVWVGFQPAERLNEVLASADIHTVLLKQGLAASSVPSKTYSVLAAGRPVIASIDPGTEVDRVLKSSGGGVSCAPDDIDGFVHELRMLLDDPPRRQAMGRAARVWVESWASPEVIAQRYVDLFRELVEGR